MPEKNELPECPACHSNDAVKLSDTAPFCAVCSPCLGGCGEASRFADTEEAVLGPWARAAEKRRALEALAAKVPRLSKKLPDSEGLWWWRESKNAKNILMCVKNEDGGDYYSMIAYSVYPSTLDYPVGKEMGGYWAKCLPPEMPEEESEDVAG